MMAQALRTDLMPEGRRRHPRGQPAVATVAHRSCLRGAHEEADQYLRDH